MTCCTSINAARVAPSQPTECIQCWSGVTCLHNHTTYAHNLPTHYRYTFSARVHILRTAQTICTFTARMGVCMTVTQHHTAGVGRGQTMPCTASSCCICCSSHAAHNLQTLTVTLNMRSWTSEKITAPSTCHTHMCSPGENQSAHEAADTLCS